MAKNKETPRKIVTKKHIARQEREHKQIKAVTITAGVIIAVAVVILAYALISSFVIKPNRVVASVGDTRIKASKFDSEVRYTRLNMINNASQYAQYAQMFGEMGSSFLQTAQGMVNQLNDSTTMGRTVIDSMIDDVLIQEEAAKLNISVSKSELSKSIEDAFGFHPDPTTTPTVTGTPVSTPTMSAAQINLIKPTETPNATKTAIATASATISAPSETATPEATLTTVGPAATATLEPSATPIPSITPTPTTYTQKLYDQNLKKYLTNVSTVGISRKQVEYSFRMQILREKLMLELTKDLKPVEDQVWARHILVPTEDEAKKVLEELEAGKDWTELAATYSTDPGSKSNGGDLGWFGKGAMVPEFEEAAYALKKVGEISAPVHSEHGWHIIQLVGRAENPISADRFQRVKQNYFNDWLKNLRASRTDIVINDDVWMPIVPNQPAVPQELISALITPVPTDIPK